MRYILTLLLAIANFVAAGFVYVMQQGTPLSTLWFICSLITMYAVSWALSRASVRDSKKDRKGDKK